MADVTVTATRIAPVFPDEAEIFDMVAAAAITAGQAIYQDSNGKAAVADANAGSSKEKFRGIALNAAGIGQAVSVLKKGHIYGFTLSGAYDSLVYLSDTAGALADAPSTTNSVPVGRVVALSDSSLTKILYIDAAWVRPSIANLVFVSSEQTGNGSAQNVAHGLGVVPSKVLISVTELPDAAAETGFDVAEGAHDATNVVATVTNTVKYKVLAFA